MQKITRVKYSNDGHAQRHCLFLFNNKLFNFINVTYMYQKPENKSENDIFLFPLTSVHGSFNNKFISN